MCRCLLAQENAGLGDVYQAACPEIHAADLGSSGPCRKPVSCTNTLGGLKGWCLGPSRVPQWVPQARVQIEPASHTAAGGLVAKVQTQAKGTKS